MSEGTPLHEVGTSRLNTGWVWVATSSNSPFNAAEIMALVWDNFIRCPVP